MLKKFAKLGMDPKILSLQTTFKQESAAFKDSQQGGCKSAAALLSSFALPDSLSLQISARITLPDKHSCSNNTKMSWFCR